MNLFYRNNKKNIRLQQQADVKKPRLVPVVCRYPHRVDANGNVPTKFVWVRSTAEPQFRFVNFLAWSLHIHLMNGKGFLFLIMRGGQDAH